MGRKRKEAKSLELVSEEAIEPSDKELSWYKSQLPIQFNESFDSELPEFLLNSDPPKEDLADFYEPTRVDWTNLVKMERIKKVDRSLKKGVGREFAVKARKLESQVKKLLKKNCLQEARDAIIEHLPVALGAVKTFIPEEAEKQLMLQESYNWNKKCYTYYNEKITEFKSSRGEKIWALEEEVLSARHPRRIERIWEKAKPFLEERYGREFRHREDVAVMLGLAQIRNNLNEKLEELNNVFYVLQRLKEFSQVNPNSKRETWEYSKGWDDAIKMWEDYKVYPTLTRCASALIGLIKDTVRPTKVIRDGGFSEGTYTEEGKRIMQDVGEGEDLLSWKGHFVDFPERIRSSGWLDIGGLIHYFPRHAKGEVSFAEAISLMYGEYAKSSEVKEEGIRAISSYELPESIKKICVSVLHEGFEKADGTDVKKVLDWFSRKVLSRWATTSVDYDNIFSYHTLDRWDKDLIGFYLTMKSGKEVNDYDEKIRNGELRFPEILREMVEKGIISEEQINPPLKPRYLKPGEVLTRSNVLLGGGTRLEDLVSYKMVKKEAISSGESALPVLDTGSQLQLRDTLNQLQRVFDPGADYRVVYRGDRIIFVEKESIYPSGDRSVGDIYRIIKLIAGADPKGGAKITIEGKDYHIKARRSLEELDKAKEACYDNESNLLAPRGVAVVTDIPTQVFRENFYKDFMAHVFIQRSRTDGNTLKSDLDSLDDFVSRTDPYSVSAWLGEFVPRTRLTTFEVEGNFGFHLRHKREADPEVFVIAKNLYEFFEENGVGIYIEPEIDEDGREQAKEKLENRLFSQKHKEEIITALRGQGLAKLLSYALMESSRGRDVKYRVSDFGSRKCDKCDKEYIEGVVSLNREQWYQGVFGGDLHALAEHPDTFVNQFRKLQKIHQLIGDVKDYIPEFVSHPEILPDLYEFIESFKKEVKASGESYIFWQSVQGSVIDRYEEEELEDNPTLRSLVNKEKEIHNCEMQASRECHEFAVRLQAKYDQITGNHSKFDRDPLDLVNFWSRQAMIFNIYQACTPKLLADGSKGMYKPIDISGIVFGY